MKKLNILIFAAMLVFASSCIKQLDIEPLQSIDATQALESGEDIESAIVGAYGILHGGALYGTNLNLIPELLGSDDYLLWRGTFQSYRQMMNKSVFINNTDAARTWIQGYRAINVANNVLANIAKVEDVDQRAQLEAEARFIRGIMLFELVRIYGAPYDPQGSNAGLGLVLNLVAVDTEEEASVEGSRSTVAQTYAQLIQDLEAAEPNLPTEYSGNDRFRATTFAAKAFLARVYLQQGNYSAALAKANEVIESGNFELNPAIVAAFGNKFTSESIFELYNNDQNNAGTANDGLTTFYASLPGIGRSDIRVLEAFADQYEATDDRRSQLIYRGTGARPNQLQNGKYTNFGQNIPVIRISEMYLIRAEANIRLGSAVGADPLDDVNTVRERSRASTLASVTLDDVLLERSFELAFEGYRIHDLKRLKLGTGAFAWDDPKLVFPIPEREIRANSNLQQNPGY